MKNAILSLAGLFIVFVAIAQVPTYVPTNGLVGYWPFNGNANDESANGNNGVVNGATLTTDRFGNVGKAYSFNGSSEIDISNFNVNYSNISIGFWFSTYDSTLLQRMITHNWEIGTFSTDLSNFNGGVSSGAFGAAIMNQTTGQININGSNNPINNKWYFYTLTYNGSSLKLYKDGYEINSVNSNLGLRNISTTLIFGGNSSYHFKGKLDDIVIYNRALSQSEITSLYNAGTNTCLPSYLPTNGLVGYWPFCGNANDESGNGNNGTVNGATLTTDRFGNVGKAYSFDGVSNYINVGDGQDLRLINTDFSINAWLIPNNLNGNHIFYKGQSSGNNFPKYLFRWYNNQYAFHINGPGLNTGTWYNSINAPTQNWQMATIVKNGNTISFYNNGILSGQTTYNSSIPNTAGYEARIGGPEPNGSGYWNGKLDDISIFNRALSATEIQSLYNASAPISCIANIINNDTTICKNASVILNATANVTTNNIQLSNYTLTQTNTVLNQYKQVVGSYPVGSNRFTLVNTTGLANKNLVLLIITQGTTEYGRYKWARIDSLNNGFVYLSNTIDFAISANDKAQLILVPEYDTLNIPSGISLTCQAWDGVTGGVLAVSSNKAVVNGSIDASYKGFRGYVHSAMFRNSAGTQGESQTGSGIISLAPNFSGGSGGNGGNPGCADASGGGGGGYISVGTRGYGDCGPPSYGGYAITDTTNRILLGAAGGEGGADEDGGRPGKGGNGGGVIILNTNSISGTGNIISNGENGGGACQSCFGGGGSGMGGGGGGAAGQILLFGSNFTNCTLNGGAGGPNQPCGGCPTQYGGTGSIGMKSYVQNPIIILQSSNYLWSTGATTRSISVSPTQTTTYYCTVSNGISSCMDSVTITVNNINSNLFSQDTIKTCGASYSLNAGSGYSSYLWNTGATTQTINATNTGWYKCTVSNGTCSGADSVFVSIVNANIVNNDTTICRGATITLSATANSEGVNSMPANLRNGLVGYWPFNGNANDESGNGNNGIVNGATLSIDRYGASNNSYSFNGIDNFISVNNSPLFDIRRDITISAWINPNSLGSEKIIVSKFKNYDDSYAFETRYNKFSYQMAVTPANWVTYYSSLPLLEINNWYMLTSTYNYQTSTVSLYINGQLVNTYNRLDTIFGSTAKLVIGNFDQNINSSYFFDGKIDDVFIYNRVLSSTEVNFLFNNTSYNWSTGVNTKSINVSPTQTTTYYCTVSNGISSCMDSVTVYVRQPTTSTTNVSVCSNQLPYIWNGVSYNTSGTYNKTLVNAAGCDSIATLNLTVKQTSTSTTTATACGSYVWNGVTYTSSGTYTKVTTNAVGCDSIATLNLTLTTANNSAPSAITGARNISRCDTLQNYSVLPMAGVTFTWTVTGTGNSVKTGQGTNAVVMVMKVAGTISVKATNACGTVSTATTLAVTKATPTTPGTIYQRFIPTIVAANTNVCLFTQSAFATTGVADTFRIRSVANATGYLWKAPTGSTVTRVNDTTIAVVFANTITVPDSIKVYTLSACDTSLVRGLALVKTTAAAPANILKSDGITVAVTDVCPNVGGSVTYKVRKVATATYYNWYMTRGTKATITHINPLGVNDTAVIVNYQAGFTADSINVSCSNGCSTSAVKLLKVSAILLPPTPSTITASTGNFYPCPTNTVQYTVTSPAATTAQSPSVVYRWTRPANTTITASNADSSVITIRFESNYAGGSLSVKCQTACGIQGTAKSQTLYYTPPTPTGINSGSGYNVCIGSTVSLTCADPVSSGEGSSQTQTPITMHRWTRPNFTSITSATADSGTISLLIQTGFTGGNVTAKCQSPCGATGTAKSQALTHTACPAGTKNSNANTGNIGSFDVNIFPNPTKSAFNLQVSSTSREAFSVKVLDVQGRLIKTISVFATEINNIGNDLKSGVYMFEITQGKEKKTVRGVKY